MIGVIQEVIYQVLAKEIITVTTFGYLMLISIDFAIFFSVYSLVLVSTEKIYQTLKTVLKLGLSPGGYI